MYKFIAVDRNFIFFVQYIQKTDENFVKNLRNLFRLFLDKYLIFYIFYSIIVPLDMR